MTGIFDDLVTAVTEEKGQPSVLQDENTKPSGEQPVETKQANAKNFYGEAFREYYKVR